ncbi:MAG: hypothetical protein ACRDHZ_23000, partial [Ktedonobacteraceae bacterium]
FTRHAAYDILGIHFDEMEVIDALVGYELGALIPIRDELMAGDLRALYIVWLVAQDIMGNVEEEDYDIRVPALPPAFGTLTAAQQELADFLQAPPEILVAAARHSQTGQAATADDFAAWVELLPPEQCKDYLVRFAQGKPGLQRLLVKDLRELGQNKMKSEPATEEYVTFATLYTESKAISAELECKQREQEELARQCRLQDVHEHQDEHWRQIDLAATRSTGKGGYDEVVRLFVELRETAEYFHETPTFQACFSTWVQAHLRRPALITRLRDKDFTV